MTRNLFVVLLVAFAIKHATASYDPTARSCDSICLTSFRFCSTGYGFDKGLAGCSFPPDAYRLFTDDEPLNSPMIIYGSHYNITWAAADPKYPVLIEWSFSSNFATLDPVVQWAINTTNSSFVFSPSARLDEFPTQFAPTTSSDTAIVLSQLIANYIRVSQPEKPGYPYTSNGVDYTWEDSSQAFSVHNYLVVAYMDTASNISADARGESVQAMWAKGVGIGVGIGVPVLLALTALIVWFVAKRRFEGAGGSKDIPLVQGAR